MFCFQSLHWYHESFSNYITWTLCFSILGDRGGLYTHCVDIRLANGTVLYQDMHPARPTCVGSFLSVWREKLVKEFQQEVSVICCEWNRCNGPNALAIKASQSWPLLGLSVIIYYLRQQDLKWAKCWYLDDGYSKCIRHVEQTSKT